MGKRQHYVPQFYLRYFANEKSMIGFYRFGSKTYQPEVPVNSIMFENWLYDQDNSYENAFSVMESQWNASLSTVIKAAQDPKDLDKIGVQDVIRVLSFVVFSELRTSKSISGLKFFMKSFLKDMSDCFGEEIVEKMDELNGIDSEYTPVQALLDTAPELYGVYLDLEWVFLVNRTTRDFVSSDVPVLSINPFLLNRGYKTGWGNGSIGLQKIIPLTPRVCLCMYDPGVYEEIGKDPYIYLDNQGDIRKINSLIVENAYEQIIFHPSFPRCEAVGYCKRKQHVNLGSVLNVFEDKNHRPIYMLVRKSLDSDYLIPGLSVKREAAQLVLSGRRDLQRASAEIISRNQSGFERLPESFAHYRGRLVRTYGGE